MIFEYETFDIDGPVLIKPKVFRDARGYFYEAYAKRDLIKAGIQVEFVQDNQAYSTKGILRGLHYQLPPYSQSKLVRVTEGKVLDVIVDIRLGSKSYGKHLAVELSDQNHYSFFVPQGFAHGYLVLSDTALFQYKCDQYYHPAAEKGIHYNDPNLGIVWPAIGVDFIVSEKDQKLPFLQ